MRLLARKNKFSLSDHGIYPVERQKNERVWTGEGIICKTEEDIFKFLGMEYKTPQERDL